MTTLLTRYISKRFLINFFSAFALITALVFMVDFVELLRQSGKYGSVGFGSLLVMGLLRLPAYSELLIPFCALTAAVATYVGLSRHSELTIMRAAGMSVWRFLTPVMVLAVLLGLLSTTVYNPLAASARAEAERMFVELFGRQKSLVNAGRAGIWLRQDGADGPSVLSASASASKGTWLGGVMVMQYRPDGTFAERIDAGTAILRDGHWLLRGAWVSRPREKPEFFNEYVVSTYLSRTQVTNRLGTIISVSFWELPDFVELIERAGLSAQRFKMQYAMLLSRPAMMLVMVLLAGTVALKAFRFGGIQTMVIIGIVTGFGFFLLQEVSRQVGAAGLVSPAIAAWVPLLVACLLSVTVLLHQEDG